MLATSEVKILKLEERVKTLELAVLTLQDNIGIPVGLGDSRVRNNGRGVKAQEILLERRKAVAILLAAEQPLNKEVISQRLYLPRSSMVAIMACDWWKRTADGYLLTPAGNQAAGKEK